MGIGNALKIRYRKYLHEHMANMVMLDEHPMTHVGLLRACTWLAKAYGSLNYTTTVVKCFEKAGFIIQSVETSNRKVDNSEIQFPFEDEDGGLLLAAEAVESNPEEIHDIDQILTEVIETNTM